MGAAVAFETARRIETMGNRPRALVVAAAGPPHHRRRQTEYWKLPREALIEKLRSLNSTPEEILCNPELIDYFLTIVRADFRVLETSRTESPAKVACPIVALAGSDDADGPREEMLAWSEMTTGAFSFSIVPGDHSFVIRKAPAVIDHIRAGLAA
jgi:surfactin synthase thioesterase subunit